MRHVVCAPLLLLVATWSGAQDKKAPLVFDQAAMPVSGDADYKEKFAAVKEKYVGKEVTFKNVELLYTGDGGREIYLELRFGWQRGGSVGWVRFPVTLKDTSQKAVRQTLSSAKLFDVTGKVADNPAGSLMIEQPKIVSAKAKKKVR